MCETGLLPMYGHEGAPAAEGAQHVARLCDPGTEIVNRAYYDRSERVAPAPAATEDRTVKRLNKLAGLLVGNTARRGSADVSKHARKKRARRKKGSSHGSKPCC
nr:hypothetical protein [Streptomyces nojiriensis]